MASTAHVRLIDSLDLAARFFMFSASRFLSLGVVCFLLCATSAYGTTDCPAIKGNVDLILSIGPWKSASGFAVITTDLQLLAGTLEASGLYPSTNRLQLSPPESLALGEPKLADFLHKPGPPTPLDKLIQVNAPEDVGQERLLLLVYGTEGYVINPSTGIRETLNAPGFPPTGAWLSSDSRQFYALNGSSIYLANYSKAFVNLVSMHSLKYNDNFVEADGQPLGEGTEEKWHVKKAFKWRGYFYVLTREMVYFFSTNVLTEQVALLKIPYGQFFTCEEPKEATKNGSGKEAKVEEETNKGKVTGARSAHPSSPRSSTTWLLIYIALGVVFLLLAVLGAFYLCRGKMTAKGGEESKGSPSQREKPRPPKRRKSTATLGGQGSLVKGPKRSRASPSKVGAPSVASKLVAPKSNALGLKKGSNRQVNSNSKIASSWKTDGKMG